MKYVAAIEKKSGVCHYVTILEEVEKDADYSSYIQKEVDDFSYANKKYDIKNDKWLDEYHIPPQEELPPEPPTIESLQKEILSLKEQQKKDNLLILRTILESVEEITTPTEGGE